MAFDGLLITEIFHSLQGETTLTGVPFAFIRLTGCNLRCTYCDSTYSFKGGSKKSIEEILAIIEPYQVEHVLLTGGEPLLQRQSPELVRRLKEKGYQVSIETHGEVSIEKVAKDARIILDVKTPSSGMSRGGFKKNLPLLKPTDEVKFVIASQDDYAWAKQVLAENTFIPKTILFSPAQVALNQPGKFSGITATWLAEKILADRLKVRLQIQLHKLLWGADRKGV